MGKAEARRSLAGRFGPGILIAATGVGAGDLATAAFAGGQIGVAVLWAVVVGALLKLVVTEGIARWQVATGQTLLEGALARLGRPAQIAFGLYLLPWCVFVGAALTSACGVAAHALVPVLGTAESGKLWFGVIHAVVCCALVLVGGFRLFERVMGVCIAVMFLSVTTTAVMLAPDWGEVVRGLMIPRVPKLDSGGLGWTVALIGGVGGTLTVLCYGYWLREQEATDGVRTNLRSARLDLGVGYTVTAIFGIAMVMIGSTVPGEGTGSGLIADLGARVGDAIGPWGRTVFLLGAWAAMVSSLLGVLQAVPMLGVAWTDSIRGGERPPSESRRRAYSVWVVALALVPLIGLGIDFRVVQKYYGVFGATFVPILAVTLLIMNGRRAWVGAMRNRVWSTLGLTTCLVFFGVLVALEIARRF